MVDKEEGETGKKTKTEKGFISINRFGLITPPCTRTRLIVWSSASHPVDGLLASVSDKMALQQQLLQSQNHTPQVSERIPVHCAVDLETEQFDYN